MRVFAFFILFLMVFSQTIDCLNTIRLNEHISLQKIKKDPLLQLIITEPLVQPPEETNQLKNIQFFVLKSVSRHKNKAYAKLIKSYQKLVNTLIQKLIIGDERLLIKSKIKQKFLKKKKLWQFGIMFMMQGQAAELEQCYHDIVKLGVMKLNFKPKTSALNERIIASSAFFKLKEKVRSELSRMPGMTIQRIEKVDITGFSISNSISLERNDIQQSIEQVKQDKNDEQMSYFAQYFFSKAEVPEQSKSLTLKVIFQIGEDLDLSPQDLEQESDQSQFQSDSNSEQNDQTDQNEDE